MSSNEKLVKPRQIICREPCEVNLEVDRTGEVPALDVQNEGWRFIDARRNFPIEANLDSIDVGESWTGKPFRDDVFGLLRRVH